jgi:hypothetical protein
VSSLRDVGSDNTGMLAAWPPHPDAVREMGRDMGRDGPIPVDATVLAVCNAAYDAAAFHGAREVGLQHLVYALTRIEAAREVLDMHGVRTTELRRDAAAAIAESVPATGPGRTPRSSVELEHTLRRAANRAGQDSVPASVHDVLSVLLTHDRETPTAELLLRSTSDPEQLERWAAEPGPASMGLQTAYGMPPQQSVAMHELVGRLEAMEQRMQALVAEVAADRKALLDLVAEIQQDMRAPRAEGGSAMAAIGDKLEQTNLAVAQLAERFEAVRSFVPNEGDLGGRLAALEGRLTEQPSAIADAVSLMLKEGRLGNAGPGGEPMTESGNAFADRLSVVEDLLRGQTERMLESTKTHERDLGEIFEALVKLGTNQQTLANNLEAWRLDSSGDVSIVSNRLERLERTLAPPLAPSRPQATVPQSGGPREKIIKRWRVLPATWREDAAALRDSLRRSVKNRG